jgi:hypothetical protein
MNCGLVIDMRISPVAAQESVGIDASIAVAASAAKPNLVAHRKATIVDARPIWRADA